MVAVKLCWNCCIYPWLPNTVYFSASVFVLLVFLSLNFLFVCRKRPNIADSLVFKENCTFTGYCLLTELFLCKEVTSFFNCFENHNFITKFLLHYLPRPTSFSLHMFLSSIDLSMFPSVHVGCIQLYLSHNQTWKLWSQWSDSDKTQKAPYFCADIPGAKNQNSCCKMQLCSVSRSTYCS